MTGYPPAVRKKHTSSRWALAIETSNPSAHDTPPSAGVAACGLDPDGACTEIIEAFLEPGGRHDDGLMPAIESLRDQLGVHPRDLDRVCVSVGPGGYTALRIAVTTAKLIAETTGAGLVAVPSAAVVAAEIDACPPFAVCLASKRGTTHATAFDGESPDLGVGRPIGLIGPDDLAAIGALVLVADRFLPGPIRDRAGALGIEIVPPSFRPATCLRIGLRLACADDVAPVYAREPEAVRLWQARNPG